MNAPKKKKSFTWLQRTFWLIAGSEISALEKCPNEYNRHANIGLMILITSLFASMTAAVAGATFVKDNFWGVFTFALIWGLVIFSLDRSMVNSIKKAPGEDEKFNWGYFWPRFVLAFILSFFMSIPLDHIVFRERILYQMDKNKANDWEKRQKELVSGYGIPGDSTAYKTAEQRALDLNNQIDAGCAKCPDELYKSNRDEANNIKNNILPQLEQDMNKAKNSYSNYNQQLRRQQTPIGQPLITNNQVVPDGELVKLWSSFKNAKREYSKRVNDMNQYLAKAQGICTQWLENKKMEKKIEDSVKRAVAIRIDSNNVKISTETSSYKQMLNEMEGFDTQFVTLFLMPNWGVQILKWLIFLALLVIEILPTYLKLKTPFGQYDWQMYERDKTTEIEVKEKIIQAEISAREIEEYRRKKEVELNKELIDKVASTEEQLANQMISNWEEKARTKMEQDVKDA